MLRPQSGCSVVPGAGLECGGVERVDGLAALAVEGHVRAPHRPALMDPEVIAAVEAESRGAVVGVDVGDALEPERRQRAGVEVQALHEVAHADPDVVDYAQACPHRRRGYARGIG